MHRHVRRSFAATGSTALLAAALLTAPGAQAAAAMTCQGKTVTIDGTGMPVVTGTPGNDVIAAGPNSTVTALAGDDTICIVRGAVMTSTSVDAGEGNDSVETGSAGQPNADKIDLGAGDDTLLFHGVQTPAGSVDFGLGNNTLVDSDGGVVTISAPAKTEERNGVVALRWKGDVTTYLVDSTATSVSFVGTIANETFVLRDPATGATPTKVALDSAGGDDTVTIRSNVIDGSTWVGGDGADLFQVAYDYNEFYLDLENGRFETGAPDVTPDQSVTGFENVDAVTATITVKGNDDANVFNLLGCDLVAVGRAGSDSVDNRVQIDAVPALTCTGNMLVARGGKDDDSIDGTIGTDRLFGNKGEDVLTAQVGNDVIFGGDDADLIRGNGGDDKVRGGKGNDALRGNPGNDRVQGDQGDDRLRGSAGNDVLVGGLGFDKGNGAKGFDRCFAVERRINCER